MNINNIIREEYITFIAERYDADLNKLYINDVAKITTNAIGYTENDSMFPHVKQMIFDAYNNGGDEAVKIRFKKMTGANLYSVRKGVFSVYPQITPHDYEEKLEENKK